MGLPEEIAARLASAKGFVSGQLLASELDVSRAAVWKAIEQLRERGMAITAIRNKGYKLECDIDILDSNLVKSELEALGCARDVLFVSQTSSTNDDAKKLIRESASSSTIVVAEAQSAGRGRRGKAFVSPEGTGVYLSIIIARQDIPANPLMLTAAAGIAVCRALKDIFDVEAGIKWVNDVYIDGKKVCGILTEAEMDLESGRPAWAVVGIGVNVYEPSYGWPAELEGKVGSVSDAVVQGMRCRLIAAMVSHLDILLDEASNQEIMQAYRKASIVIGREVGIAREDGSTIRVRVLDIADDLNLVVEQADSVASDAFTIESSRTSVIFDI